MSAFESVVEEAAIDIFEELGYAYRPGPELEEERGRVTEVLLERRFREALARINPHLPADALDDVARRVVQPPTAAVEENNRQFHRHLTRGVDVEVRREDEEGDGGQVRGDLAWLVSFDRPELNDWLVTNQLTVRGPERTRRPDLVVYLNGLPVAVFELKNPEGREASLEQAWEDLQEYRTDIPSLFDTNEILAISDGTEARIGSLTAGSEWFGPWKSIEGERPEPGTRSTIERLLRGLFDRGRFLDYLQHFILWEADGPRIKKIAGYHQFYAVRKAVRATVERYVHGGDHRIGVIWHTQGSGKSVSMVFYAGQAVRRPELENPTLVVLTDRIDLDDQLYRQFATARDLLPSPVQADSRERLKDLLSVAAGGVIFSTLQKFGTAKGRRMETLTERRNVIVLADEAHRSHYEFEEGLAKNLRDALPNALYLGFTGTPVELTGRVTVEVFGEYLDVYPMRQSVEDGATVPILYEGRQNRVYLLEERLKEVDLEVAETVEDLPETERERLLREETRIGNLLGDPGLVEGLAADLIEHWERRRDVVAGKGMIVTPLREVAVLLYERIAELRPAWCSDEDGGGRIKVVITGEEKDVARYGEMFRPHIRDRRGIKQIERRFKDPDDPLELVIVVDMWLTGFDVPPAHTLYLYKPMRGHTLMQAIARVNRKWGDKEAGLIVDYVGVGEDLKRAVGAYGGYPGERSAAPVEERLRALQERFEVVRSLFHGFDSTPFFEGSDRERVRTLVEAADHLAGVDDGIRRFFDAMAGLNAAASMALHLEEARSMREEVAFFQAIQRNLRKYTSTGERSREDAGRSISHREREHRRQAIRQIIQGTVASEGMIDIFEAAGLPKPDVSILSEEFLAAVRASPYKSLEVEILRKLLEDEIRAQRRHNVVQARKFSEMLQDTLNRYRNQGLQAAQVILELIEMARDLRDAPKRGDELGLSEDELAFYDALADHEGVTDVMGDDTLSEIAHELVESIRRSVTIDWTQKEAVRAKMRSRIKRLLRRHGYPPDKREAAVITVIEQAEALCRDWAPQNGDGAGPAAEPPPRIVRDARGSAMVAGANTKVVEIVAHRRAYGGSPEEIHEALPHLSVAQIEAALTYFEEHRDEVEEDLERREREVERLRHELGQPPIAEKIRELRERD